MGRNILANYLPLVVGMVVSLFSTPILLHYVGKEAFGVWAVLLSFLGYLCLIEAGVSSCVSKRVAECLALDLKEKLAEILGTVMCLYVAMIGMTLLVVGIVALSLGHLLHIAPALLPTARLCLAVLGIYQCFQFCGFLYNSMLLGWERLDISAVVASIINTLIAVMQMIFAWRGGGIVSLGIALLVGNLVSLLLTRRQIKRLAPHIPMRFRNASRPMAMELLRFGSRNAFIGVAGLLAYGSDLLLIGLFLPVTAIPAYAVAARLSALIGAISTKPMAAFLPAHARVYVSRDNAKQYELFMESVSIACGLCLPFVIVFLLAGNRIVAAWVGPGFPESYAIGAVLISSTFFLLPGNACYTLMIATERNQKLPRIYLVGAICNALISVTLIQRIGAIGAAYGSLAMTATVDFILLPVIVCRDFGFSLRRYVRDAFAPLLLPLMVSLLSGVAMRSLPVAPPRLVMLVWLGATMGLCWAVWICFGLPFSRRERMLAPLKRLAGKQNPETKPDPDFRAGVPMRITMALPAYVTYPCGGFKVIYEIANQLTERGHTVTILHPCTLKPYETLNLRVRSRLWPLKMRFENRPLIAWFGLNPGVKIRLVSSLQETRLPQADILLAVGQAAAHGLLACPSDRGKKFLLVNEFEDWMTADEATKARMTEIYGSEFRCISASPATQRMLAEAGVTPVGEMRNGLDWSLLGVENPIEARSPYRIGFPVWSESFKGLFDAIQALMILRNRYGDRLEVTGFGRERPAFLPDWIEFAKNLSDAELKTYYNEQAIFLFPSHYEGWGLPACEAQACGAALVTTDCVGMREFARDCETALVVPKQRPYELANAVSKLIEHPQLRINLAKRAAQEARHYTWERATDRMEAIFALP